jgi:hypothetical protein
MTDFGSSLFKVHSGTASYADILSVLKQIVEDDQFRSRCASLSGLVADIEEEQRASNCAAMVNVYFANFASSLRDPQQAPGPYLGTFTLVSRCSPPKHGPWRDHVFANSDRKGRTTSATFSSRVGEVLVALEHMWGVPGRFVVKT